MMQDFKFILLNLLCSFNCAYFLGMHDHCDLSETFCDSDSLISKSTYFTGEDEVDELSNPLLHGLLKVHIIEAKVGKKENVEKSHAVFPSLYAPKRIIRAGTGTCLSLETFLHFLFPEIKYVFKFALIPRKSRKTYNIMFAKHSLFITVEQNFGQQPWLIRYAFTHRMYVRLHLHLRHAAIVSLKLFCKFCRICQTLTTPASTCPAATRRTRTWS